MRMRMERRRPKMIPKVVLFSSPTIAWLKAEARKSGLATNEVVRRIVDEKRFKALKKSIKKLAGA